MKCTRPNPPPPPQPLSGDKIYFFPPLTVWGHGWLYPSKKLPFIEPNVSPNPFVVEKFKIYLSPLMGQGRYFKLLF